MEQFSKVFDPSSLKKLNELDSIIDSYLIEKGINNTSAVQLRDIDAISLNYYMLEGNGSTENLPEGIEDFLQNEIKNRLKSRSEENSTNSLEINEHYLELKKRIENFDSNKAYSNQDINAFHFFFRKITKIIKSYENFNDKDKTKAKQFIIDGLNLLKSKAEEYAKYVQKNINNNGLLKSDSVSEDYKFAYNEAKEKGLV